MRSIGKARDEIESTLFSLFVRISKNGRFHVFAGRPGERRKNRESPGKTGRVGRSAKLSKLISIHRHTCEDSEKYTFRELVVASPSSQGPC